MVDIYTGAILTLTFAAVCLVLMKKISPAKRNFAALLFMAGAVALAWIHKGTSFDLSGLRILVVVGLVIVGGAILVRRSIARAEVSRELREAQEVPVIENVDSFHRAKLALWDELYNLPANQSKVCASVVRKYSTDMVRAQSVLRDLSRLRVP